MLSFSMKLASREGGLPPMIAGELTVEGASVTVAQNIECCGESANAMFDLSVSAPASREPTTAPFTLVRGKVQIPSTLFVQKVSQGFSRS